MYENLLKDMFEIVYIYFLRSIGALFICQQVSGWIRVHYYDVGTRTNPDPYRKVLNPDHSVPLTPFHDYIVGEFYFVFLYCRWCELE
jgi:hypothetical protein